MSATKDQRPVKDLISNGPYPALGERGGFRRTDGGRDDAGTLGLEDGVEGAGELRVSIADEEANAGGQRLFDEQVARVLGDEGGALRSRSTSFHRNAKISPSRIPVPSASVTGPSASRPRTLSRVASHARVSGTFSVARGARGGRIAAAALTETTPSGRLPRASRSTPGTRSQLSAASGARSKSGSIRT